MAAASLFVQSIGQLTAFTVLLLSITVFRVTQASPNCQGTIQNKGYPDCAVRLSTATILAMLIL